VNALPNSNAHYAGGIPSEFYSQSKLQTVELNLRRRHTYFDLLFGVRYVDFRESLAAASGYASPIANGYASQLEPQPVAAAYNNLFGFQTGVDAVLWESADGKLRFDSVGKAGIYYNNMTAHYDLQVYNGLGTPPVITLVTNSSKAAFLGELGVNAAYQFNRHLALRAGYEILWLSGVAAAGQQSPPAVGSKGLGTLYPDWNVNGNASAFYHGANAGLEVAW
jgi:hypothetical protein